ncbi:hypothetical protein BJV74DRAFT_782121, partial [Russula compacta]
ALDSMNSGPTDSSSNALMIQFFTWDCSRPGMIWWQHLEAEVPRFAELGVTQVWIPPVHKAASPVLITFFSFLSTHML